MIDTQQIGVVREFLQKLPINIQGLLPPRVEGQQLSLSEHYPHALQRGHLQLQRLAVSVNGVGQLAASVKNFAQLFLQHSAGPGHRRLFQIFNRLPRGRAIGQAQVRDLQMRPFKQAAVARQQRPVQLLQALAKMVARVFSAKRAVKRIAYHRGLPGDRLLRRVSRFAETETEHREIGQ